MSVIASLRGRSGRQDNAEHPRGFDAQIEGVIRTEAADNESQYTYDVLNKADVRFWPLEPTLVPLGPTVNDGGEDKTDGCDRSKAAKSQTTSRSSRGYLDAFRLAWCSHGPLGSSMSSVGSEEHVASV